jgi:YidC/Oxa1 family membrane protein insertase
VFQFLADVLAFFYEVWPSYGGAIILFTLAIMLVLSPLSIKSARSMIAMQRVGPELKKIQAKHKNDREALNREMMAFYQEHGINPFSSCLPILLQMPVFIVLYQVLIGLTRRGDDGNFNPKYLEDDPGPLAMALRATDKMMSFGMDLSQSALSELQNEGLITALPYVMLVALVVLTSFVQQRQIQGRNTGNAVNPQQQMIGKILPFIFIPISVTIPSGVVIYFVVSNTVRIAQQALVTKLDFSPKALAAAEAKREARLAKAKDDAIDVGSEPVADRPSKAVTTGKAPKAATPASDEPAAEAPARGRRRSGSGAATGPASRPAATSPITSGRVTPPGSRPKNRKRTRK